MEITCASRGRVDVVLSSCCGAASNNPHAVVTVRGSCSARSVGKTGVARRYAQNGRLSLRCLGCAIDNGGRRSARIGNSALGRFPSLALLTVVGLGDLLLSKQLFNSWL